MTESDRPITFSAKAVHLHDRIADRCLSHSTVRVWAGRIAGSRVLTGTLTMNSEEAARLVELLKDDETAVAEAMDGADYGESEA